MSDVLQSRLVLESEVSQANRAAMEQALAALADVRRGLTEAGGPKYVEVHRSRGKLLARERIERLVDRGAPFLELGAYAAWGSEFAVGASVVTGIGHIRGVECVILAHEPTVRGGALNPHTLRKTLRAWQIARENRLPVISLVESGGADLPTQAELFVPAGAMFRDLTQLSDAGIPTVAIVFGNATAGGAYLPAMSDYIIMIRGRSKVFLGGPPLVKMATGEESDDETLGGADMHASVSGLADYLVDTEEQAIATAREVVGHLGWQKQGRGPTESAPLPPCYSEDELVYVVPSDLRHPFDPKEVLARVLDGSRFEVFKPRYGTSLVCGFGSIVGYQVGVLANDGVLFSEEAQKAAQFIQLCNRIDVPLIFMQNTTGYMVGRDYERGGIVKDGAKMINAVANSGVPHITLQVGNSYGAGNYGMCGRSLNPRFLFVWPNAKTAVMGGRQLAGVMSIVRRQAAASRGVAFDEFADHDATTVVEAQIEAESTALSTSGRGYDDGIIDPRDTRVVLAMALSACHSAPVSGSDSFGVFRM